MWPVPGNVSFCKDRYSQARHAFGPTRSDCCSKSLFLSGCTVLRWAQCGVLTDLVRAFKSKFVYPMSPSLSGCFYYIRDVNQKRGFLVRAFAYPSFLFDLESLFGRLNSSLSLIINYTVGQLWNSHRHCLIASMSWNRTLCMSVGKSYITTDNACKLVLMTV